MYYSPLERSLCTLQSSAPSRPKRSGQMRCGNMEGAPQAVGWGEGAVRVPSCSKLSLWLACTSNTESHMWVTGAVLSPARLSSPPPLRRISAVSPHSLSFAHIVSLLGPTPGPLYHAHIDWISTLRPRPPRRSSVSPLPYNPGSSPLAHHPLRCAYRFPGHWPRAPTSLYLYQLICHLLPSFRPVSSAPCSLCCRRRRHGDPA